MIYGSSRISSYKTISGLTAGPTGATGANGPTGSTGSIGPTGSTGGTGYGISGGVAIGNTLHFYGITGITLGSFYSFGAVGVSSGGEVYKIVGLGVDEQNQSTNIIFGENEQFVKGVTAVFKGFTLSGFVPGITKFVGMSADASTLYFHGATVAEFQTPLGITGELIFVDPSVGFGLGVLKGAAAKNTQWDASKNQLTIDQVFTREAIYQNKNWNAFGTNPFDFVPDSTAFSYYGGLTGLKGATFGTATLQNALTPQLIYFASAQYGIETIGATPIEELSQTITLGFTGGATMEFITFPNTPQSGGWTFTYEPQNITRESIGSCCFCQNPNEDGTSDKICLDYVSRQYCTSISGSFDTSACKDRSTSSDCYFEGACCVYDSETQETKCVNTSSDLCAKFHGVFNYGKHCGGAWNNGELFECPTSICSTGPVEVGKCCVAGRCFNLSKVTCESIFGTTWSSGQCVTETTDPTCCAAHNIVGACCKPGPNHTCVSLDPQDCMGVGGIFKGFGSKCSEVSCCGSALSDDYFKGVCADSCKALGPNQIYSCLEIGTKIGGGYFAGFVGMPNPCNGFSNPNLAHGEPLECLCNPRGVIQGNPNWKYKTCLGISGADNAGSIDYFARTYPVVLPKASLDSQCILKAGVPFVQQAYNLNDILWPSARLFEGTSTYTPNRGKHSFSLIDTGLAVEYFDGFTSNLYQYLSAQVYGENDIHVLWALIVGPEDIEVVNNEKKLSWGMMQGCHKANSSGVSIEINTEEIPTYPVDGLLSTRIHDSSSKDNPNLWFRSDITSNQIPGFLISDKNAYMRFTFGRGSNFNSSFSEQKIKTNKTIFKEAYAQMWDSQNPLDSALRQISITNETQSYGYNDWYIPSITELNYIYANIGELTGSMIANGDEVMDGDEYWSSTSVSRLIYWNKIYPLDKDFYKLDPIDSNIEPYLSHTRITSEGNIFGLNEDTAYEFTQSVANGQKMLTQVFNNDDTNSNLIGMVASRDRSARIANLRPVRRIPFVVTCDNFTYTSSMLTTYFSGGTAGCSSCLDHVEGLCPNE